MASATAFLAALARVMIVSRLPTARAGHGVNPGVTPPRQIGHPVD